MLIEFKINAPLEADEVIALFRASGIRRPVDDKERITRMIRNANLIITAWDQDKLVGIARSLSDFAYCTYLSDLAVHRDYQHRDIGRQLIGLTRQETGPESMLLLLASETAMGYYPRVGFEKVTNGFIMPRLEPHPETKDGG